MKKRLHIPLLLLTALWLLSACAPGAPAPSQETASTVVVTKEAAGETVVEISTATPAAAPETEGSAALPPSPQPTQAAKPAMTATASPPPATPQVEPRIVEVEWPARMHLGDSDVVRLALVPSTEGYQVTAEFPEHQTLTQDVPVVRQAGYELYAVARLDGVGFEIAPAGEQASLLPEAQAVSWHWSLTPRYPGHQRLTINLQMRWEPLPGTPGEARQAAAYSRGLDVQVNSFFGLTRRQALLAALLGLSLGGGTLSAALSSQRGGLFRTLAARRPARTAHSLVDATPDPALTIEQPTGMRLSPQEANLLRALFRGYARLQVRQEFLSGYSGARTLLLTPIRQDERADAPTIAKLGARTSIQREYTNYQTFVSRTLPPVTARIPAPPATMRGNPLAGLQYTFIGQQDSPPVSLRQALQRNPDPALIHLLFETFGPGWWMQRAPWTFHWAQEYDRLLPPHAVLQPDSGEGLPAAPANLRRGARLQVTDFTAESGGGGAYHTLTLPSGVSGVPLRLRWLDTEVPRHPVGRVATLREDVLRARVEGMPLFGLPDPLTALPALLESSVTGSRSIIHGDLNLENILLGPGNLVWLIDFEATREGHPLMDFAHLEEEMLAHLLVPHLQDAAQVPVFLAACGLGEAAQEEGASLPPAAGALLPLFREVHRVAYACLANPLRPAEYHIALQLACLGALKYRNLEAHQRHCLYVAAAFLSTNEHA
ncbi:MAG: hypothetical protein Fur0018_01490 [Anaerolineales bacterium]